MLFAFDFSNRSVLWRHFLVVCMFVVVCSCCSHIVLSLTTNFLFFKASKQALWPTQLPTQLVMTLISHLHIVLRLRMCGAIPPLLHMSRKLYNVYDDLNLQIGHYIHCTVSLT